jgi:hypothetical protein
VGITASEERPGGGIATLVRGSTSIDGIVSIPTDNTATAPTY